MKLIAKRCTRIWSEMEPHDEPGNHRWADEPVIDVGELGPIAWWKCTECPAMALYDPETEDGFQAEIVVVYPPEPAIIVHPPSDPPNPMLEDELPW